MLVERNQGSRAMLNTAHLLIALKGFLFFPFDHYETTKETFDICAYACARSC